MTVAERTRAYGNRNGNHRRASNRRANSKRRIGEFKWDARVQPNEIGVVVKDGTVTPHRLVDSYSKEVGG